MHNAELGNRIDSEGPTRFCADGDGNNVLFKPGIIMSDTHYLDFTVVGGSFSHRK